MHSSDVITDIEDAASVTGYNVYWPRTINGHLGPLLANRPIELNERSELIAR